MSDSISDFDKKISVQNKGFIWILSLLSSCVLIAMASYYAYATRVSALENASRISNVMTSLATNQVTAFMNGIVHIFDGLDALYKVHPTIRTPFDPATRDVLLRHRATQTEIIDLLVLDKTGHILQWTMPESMDVPDLTDRDYVLAHAQAKQSSLFISNTRLSRVHENEWFFAVSRAGRAADGDVDYILVAIFHSRGFEEKFENTRFGEHGSILLGKSNGNILYRNPELERFVGTKNPEAMGTYAQAVQSGGMRKFDMISPLDGRHRIVTASLVSPDLPLIVATTVDVEDVLAVWKRDTTLLALIVVLAVLALMYMARRLVLGIHREKLGLWEAKKAAEEAASVKSEFLAIMSHELRTPLNSIIGFSDMMRYEIKGPLPKDYIEYTTLIGKSGKLLLETINGILDMSKLESGNFEIFIGSCSMCEIVDDVLSMMEVQAQAKGIKLVNNTAGLHDLDVDQVRIKQVLLNVIGNAVKFTDTGQVTVDRYCNSDGHNITVTDTGIGMSTKDVELAFKPFKQVQGTSLARRHQGTGLGLAISRHMMQLHGGDLLADSIPGKGTVVTLHFPPGAGIEPA